jgi:DNA-directed RNA polymerase subunit RPC12/RpoP
MSDAKTFQCPSCGSPILTSGADKEVKCQYCGNTVIVPEELREKPAPTFTPTTFDFGQTSPFNGETLQTIETVGKATAGVAVGITAMSVILPIALTCIILGAVGAIMYFVFSNVKSAVQAPFPSNVSGQSTFVPDTALPTDTPQPIDTPVPYSKVLFKDNFTKTSSGWDVSHSTDYTLEYKGGKYHILVKKAGQAVWIGDSYTDVSVEVDVQETAGANDGMMGVSCRAGSNGGMYTFEFDQNGDYGIYKYDTNGNATALDESTLNPNTVNQGSINHIQGVCAGNTQTLVLNGQVLLKTEDSDYTKGGAGLIVRTGSGDASVDTLFSSFLLKGP